MAPPRLAVATAAADEPLGSPAAASEAACREGGGRLMAPTGASRGGTSYGMAEGWAMTGTARSAAGPATGVSGPSLAGDERIRLGTAYRGADHGMVDKMTMAGRVARLRGFGLEQLIAFLM